METRKQQLLVIICSGIFLVLASITATYLLKTGSLSGDADGNGYKNITFTDAVISCEKRVKDQFNDRLITFEVDNHSSRYENKLFIYKIFLKAKIVTKNNKHGNTHFINCFIASSDGQISKFDVFEETEQETEAVTEKETNAFGWPK